MRTLWIWPVVLSVTLGCSDDSDSSKDDDESSWEEEDQWGGGGSGSPTGGDGSTGGASSTDGGSSTDGSTGAELEGDDDGECTDGIDNDEDGYTDCADWDCSHNPAVSIDACADAPKVCE